MSKEISGHIDPLERLKILFEGYFQGKTEEIQEESRIVGDWPQSIKLGNKVIRQDQALDSLARLIDEIKTIQAYVDSSIDTEMKKQNKT